MTSPSAKHFRVRQIPQAWTEEDLAQALRTEYSLTIEDEIQIYSLVPSLGIGPCGNWLVATVS